MKKLLIGVCALSILAVSTSGWAGGDYVSSATSRAGDATMRSSNVSSPKAKDKDPTPVESRKGANYSKGAGNKAAATDIAIDLGGIAAGLILQMFKNKSAQGPVTWEPLWFSFDVVGGLMSLAHGAVNKWMRDATMITASFTGTEGFVTDKWVGPHPRNTVTEVMGEFSVASQDYKSLQLDKKDYGNITDAEKASARQLQEYRQKELISDQRSLSDRADETWKKLYTAQRHCISGLASALEFKRILAELNKIEGDVVAKYDNKTSSLNTFASRRSMYNALLLLRMNVAAARTKLRAHILELDFKPKTEDDDSND